MLQQYLEESALKSQAANLLFSKQGKSSEVMLLSTLDKHKVARNDTMKKEWY